MNPNNFAMNPGQVADIGKMIDASQREDSTILIPYAATLVLPSISKADTTFIVATLTGNTIVPALVGMQAGDRVTFLFTADATGARTITWNAQMAFTANGANTANQKGATCFVYDGTRFQQTSGALVFKA